MKKLLTVLALSAFTVSCSAESAKPVAVPVNTESKKGETNSPETKRVCIMVWDAKLNKEVEKCRIIKIREKHEGTAVPDGKKK
jgi:hypothetical protein